MALTKKDLDKLAARGCQFPGCDHSGHDRNIFLHARCHIAGGVEVSYEFGTGVLHIACRACHKTIADVKVQE